MPRRPLVIAHRGAHDDGTPENTIAAFERARRLGADMVELDVRRTRDGELVVFHDREVDRRPLRTLTADELARAAGHRPPTLAEALAWASDAAMPLDVELKEDGYLEEVLPLLRAYARHTGGDGMIVTSFLDTLLRKLTAQAPELNTGLLVAVTATGVLARARAARTSTLVVRATLLRERLLTRALDDGLAVLAWDIAADSPWCADTRLAGVIVDDLLAVLQRRDREL